MRKYLSRRLVYLSCVLISLFFILYTLPSVGGLRESLVREYFKHKEFLFLLKNAPLRNKEPATEELVTELFSRYALKPEGVYRSEGGVEVKIKEVNWEILPSLVKDLEDRFDVVSLTAVDNTGKGIFELRVVLR